MKEMIFAIALVLGTSATVAFAQDNTTTPESQSKMTVEEAKDSKNKVSGDIDSELTNAKLRAESGSKSKWSLSTEVDYQGGTVNHAFGVNRPNLSGSPGTSVNSMLQIGPSVRYRWTKNDSFTAGTMVGVRTPFQGSVVFNKRTKQRVDQFSLLDPTIAYYRAGKIGWFQTNGNINTSFGTSTESRNIDNSMAPGVSYTLLHVFQNGLTIGTAASFNYMLYTSSPAGNSANFDPSGAYGGDGRDQWNLGLYPFVEYEINDRYSFRTLFGYFNWHHIYGDSNNWRTLRQYVYQSVGLGISVTRDIYLYPNIQFVPDNIRSDFTNVALNATLNVF